MHAPGLLPWQAGAGVMWGAGVQGLGGAIVDRAAIANALQKKDVNTYLAGALVDLGMVLCKPAHLYRTWLGLPTLGVVPEGFAREHASAVAAMLSETKSMAPLILAPTEHWVSTINGDDAERFLHCQLAALQQVADLVPLAYTQLSKVKEVYTEFRNQYHAGVSITTSMWFALASYAVHLGTADGPLRLKDDTSVALRLMELGMSAAAVHPTTAVATYAPTLPLPPFFKQQQQQAYKATHKFASDSLKGKCYNCHCPGHLQAACPLLQQQHTALAKDPSHHPKPADSAKAGKPFWKNKKPKKDDGGAEGGGSAM
jgi:hypothetical protein